MVVQNPPEIEGGMLEATMAVGDPAMVEGMAITGLRSLRSLFQLILLPALRPRRPPKIPILL